MNRGWLIRTGGHQILGPVTDQKLKELLAGNLLKIEDEVCSGNGFWFFIKEKEFLDEYLFNGGVQPFNPVSEAIDILGDSFDSNTSVFNLNDLNDDLTAAEKGKVLPFQDAREGSILPPSSDLEYPEVEKSAGRRRDDIEKDPDHGKQNLSQNKVEVKADHIEDGSVFPSSDELEFPEVQKNEYPSAEKENETLETSPEVDVIEIKPGPPKEMGDSWLYIIFFILVLIAIGALYIKREIIFGTFSKTYSNGFFVTEVNAQEMPLIKKKTHF